MKEMDPAKLPESSLRLEVDPNFSAGMELGSIGRTLIGQAAAQRGSVQNGKGQGWDGEFMRASTALPWLRECAEVFRRLIPEGVAPGMRQYSPRFVEPESEGKDWSFHYNDPRLATYRVSLNEKGMIIHTDKLMTEFSTCTEDPSYPILPYYLALLEERVQLVQAELGESAQFSPLLVLRNHCGISITLFELPAEKASADLFERIARLPALQDAENGRCLGADVVGENERVRWFREQLLAKLRDRGSEFFCRLPANT